MNTNDILYYYIMFRFQELAEVSRSNYWIVKRNLAINKKQSWIVYITSYIFFLCIVYIILYVSTVIHIHTDKPTKRWTFYTKLTSERTFSPRFFLGSEQKNPWDLHHRQQSWILDPTELQQLCEGRAPQWAKVRLGMMGDFFQHQILVGKERWRTASLSLRGFENTGNMMGLGNFLDKAGGYFLGGRWFLFGWFFAP